jgi:hypothetical protein
MCWSRGGCWSRLWQSWRVDAGAHQEKQIDEKDGDKDKTTDEDVGAETEDGSMFGKVGGRDVVVLVAAFVMMFGHAHQLICKMRLSAG